MSKDINCDSAMNVINEYDYTVDCGREDDTHHFVIRSGGMVLRWKQKIKGK